MVSNARRSDFSGCYGVGLGFREGGGGSLLHKALCEVWAGPFCFNEIQLRVNAVIFGLTFRILT